MRSDNGNSRTVLDSEAEVQGASGAMSGRTGGGPMGGAKAKRCRAVRWMFWGLLGCGLSATACLVALIYALPSARVDSWVSAGVSYVYGGVLRVEGLRVFPELRVETLDWDLPENLRAGGKIQLRAEGIAATYALPWDGGKWLNRVSVHALEVTYAGVNAGGTRGPMESYAGVDVGPWLPRELTVERLAVRLMKAGEAMYAAPLKVLARRSETGGVDVHVDAPALSVRWGREGEEAESAEGTLAVHATYGRADNSIDAEVNLAPLVQGKVSLHHTRGGDAPGITVEAEDLSFGTPLWRSWLQAWLPSQVSWDAVEVHDLRVGWRQALGWEQLKAAGAVYGLVWNAGNEPYLHSDVRFDVQRKTGEDRPAIVGTLWLDHDWALSLEGSIAEEGTRSLRLSTPSTSLAQAAESCPVLVRRIQQIFPKVHAFSGELTWHEQGEGVEVLGTLYPEFDAGKAVEIRLDAKRSDALGVPWNAEGSVVVDDERVDVQATLGSEETALQITAQAIHPSRWWGTFRGEYGGFEGVRTDVTVDAVLRWDKGFEGTVSGKAYGMLGLLGEEWADDAVLYAFDLRYGVGIPLVVQGQGTLSLGDLVAVQVADAEVNISTAQATATLKTALDLEKIAEYLHLADLWGDVELEAVLRWAEGRLTGNLQALTTGLGYGGWSTPYGTPLRLTGTAAWAEDGGALRVTDLRATLGDDATLLAAGLEWDFGDQTAVVVQNFSLETNLRPFVQKKWLDAGEGTLTANAEVLRFSSAGSAGEIHVESHAQSLRLAGKYGEFSGLAGALVLKLGNETPFSGAGTWQAEAFTFGRLPFSGVRGDLRITPQEIGLESLQADLFGGRVSGTLRFGWGEGGTNAALDLGLEHIDLQRMTDALKPPLVLLDGLAGGKVQVQTTGGELSQVVVDVATSGPVWVNRATVEQILMSHYVQEATGSKTISHVVRRVIGSAEKRKFDSGILKASLEEGILKGTAILKSPDLDLTVDINAEPATLLRLLQESTE